MLVLGLEGQPRVNPVLLAFGVIPHVRVAKRRQFTGGIFGGVSRRAGAIDDDLRRFIRQKRRRKFRHPIGRQVDCARQVRVVKGGRRQSLYELKLATPINFPL